MAFKKENYIEFGEQLTYWRYSLDSEKSLEENIITIGCPTDDNGMHIPQKGLLILMDGYKDEESRRENQTPLKVHQFLICNWEEVILQTRAATLEEKQAMPQFQTMDTDTLEATQFDIVLSKEKNIHYDFDSIVASIDTPAEARTIYNVLRNNPVSRAYFGDAINT